MTQSSSPSTAQAEVELTRVLDAPRELVFKAWTEAERLANWWGPHGFSNPVCEADARPGGAIRIVMRGPNGVDYPMLGTFHEVVAPERIVFAAVAEDAQGNVIVEGLNTITLSDEGGKTRMTVKSTATALTPLGAEALAGMREGWSQSLGRLVSMLDRTRTSIDADLDAKTLNVERLFDAPRELVFQVWSDAESLSRWWGPKDWTLPVCTVDFRPGGVWHYCMEGPDGTKSWGRAVYNEIVPGERIVYTDAFSDEQGNITPGMPVMKISVEFVAEGTKTRLVSRSEFATREELESLMQMGVVEGLTQTWDRLEEYLATL